MHASILTVVVVVMALQQAETQTTTPQPSCVDIARQSRPGMLGGWRKRGSAESPELRQVVKDVAIQAIQSYFDNGQTPTWRVTEVYTQVVAGMNYCIRFKTFEKSCAQPDVCDYKTSVCDAHIHRPLPRSNKQITVKSVQCA